MAEPRGLLIAAPASGSGKTFLTLALLRALRAAGVKVASAKAGPDYIDPRFHEAATGAPCPNLDPWAMAPAQLRALAAQSGDQMDIETFGSAHLQVAVYKEYSNGCGHEVQPTFRGTREISRPYKPSHRRGRLILLRPTAVCRLPCEGWNRRA